MARLAPFFPGLPGPWTAGASLPGGDFPWDGAAALKNTIQQRYPFLSHRTNERLVHSYGTLATDMLGDAATASDLGRTIGADLTEREIAWLRRTEWARSADDILWRRSKLGLRFDPAQRHALESLLAER